MHPKPWFVERLKLTSPDRLATLVRLLGGEGHGHACLTHLEAREAAHGDVLAQLADLGRNQLRRR